MSKELVVSTTRHETRVAILEDDQVVEVYYQREKEYSLAGSIHKGRVTRVLPGMQSAFVDIGLERDAFLYVSDFFEDNDEYDKIVSSVEEKVLKLDKEPALAAAPPIAPIPEITEPPAPVAAAPSVPVVMPERTERVSERPPDRPGERGGDDRGRGRRSRRRRPKGRGGLPESKYFTPGVRHYGPEVSSAAPEAEAAAEEFPVLPGESLAKYAHEDAAEQSEPVPEAVPETLIEAASEPEAPAASEAESFQTEPAVVVAPEAEPEREAAQVSVQQVPPAEAEPVADTHAAISAPEMETAQPEHSGQMEELPELPSAEPYEVSETVTHVQAEAPESTVEPETVEPEALLAEADVAESDALEPEYAEPETPEPARIPTSLTATLREQGPRYQHRISRRMRRKMRGGLPDERRQEGQRGPETVVQARTEPRPEPRPDVRPEQRVEARPDARVEKADRQKPAGASISDLLREGQEIIVQIAKEPLGQKGARITSHIALPGRFLVYMPTVDHIGVSRKISTEEERTRLKRVLQAHRAGIPGGYIVRTAGEGKTEEELRADMMFLYNLWMDMRQKAEKRPAPLLVHHDLDVVERILRDQLTSAFKTVWVDNEQVYESVLSFVQRFQQAMVGRIKLYTRPTPIFDEFGVTPELEKALRPKVWLKSGGYIVINQTEALVAIDINTGKYVGKSNRLEDTIVKTNTDAIREIVRQIRLRDLGGIIVVDFIDMDERKNRQKVMQALEEAMRNDRAPYKILQFNDFGLVAITRKRVKQSLERTLCSPCPYCEGAGYVKSVQTAIGEILQEAQKIAKVIEGNDVVLRVNPEVAKLLKSNQNSYLQEIEEILGRNVIVKSDPLLHQEKFDLR